MLRHALQNNPRMNAVPSIAANSSSLAVCSRFHPIVIPPSSGFTSTVRSPLSSSAAAGPSAPACTPSALRQRLHIRPRPPRNRLKDIPRRRQPRLNPVNPGCTLPGTTPQTPGTSSVSRAIAMMHVDVPTTFTTSPSLHPAPIASQCASNAPTGIGISAFNPISFAHRSLKPTGHRIRRPVLPRQLLPHPIQQRVPASTKTPATAAHPTADSTSTYGPSHKRCAEPSPGP